MPSRSSANQPPRKALIATTMFPFRGSASDRAQQALNLIEQAARQSRMSHGRGPDLIVLPEHSIQNGGSTSASQKAVPIDGPDLTRVVSAARHHQTYLIVPAILSPRPGGSGVTNSAVLVDREGMVAGVYDKAHPVLGPDNTLEGGIAPGQSYPVFECDFGRVGIQICWDMSFDEGWNALAEHGAEIVALCSASPQTVRPAMYALRGHCFVVTSTPRNNASIFTPIGTIAAQTREDPILVHEIDLAYAIVHWAAQLDNGTALARRFGPRVGYTYSETEDTGVFWSNDPQTPIGDMIAELDLMEMSQHVEASRRAVEQHRREPCGRRDCNKTPNAVQTSFESQPE